MAAVAYAAVAVVGSIISGIFGSRSAKKKAKAEAKAQMLSDKNKVYMAALQRQWSLADRRYRQDQFGSLARFAPNDYGPATDRIDPTSITATDPYSTDGRGPTTTGGTSLTTPAGATPPPTTGTGTGSPVTTGTGTPQAKSGSVTAPPTSRPSQPPPAADAKNYNASIQQGFQSNRNTFRSNNPQGGGAGWDAAGAIGASVVSGYFGARADSRTNRANAQMQAQNSRNSAYMMALERQWELADRRYRQDQFGSLARFSPNDYGPAQPRIDPNSITPRDPYANTGRNPPPSVGGGTSLTGNSQVSGSPNPAGKMGAPGAPKMQRTTNPSWRATA